MTLLSLFGYHSRCFAAIAFSIANILTIMGLSSEYFVVIVVGLWQMLSC